MLTFPLTLQSSAHVQPGAIPASNKDFLELATMFKKVEPTPNPRNPAYNIHRSQCTFGLDGGYSFGEQTSQDMGPLNGAPEWVQKCVNHAKEIIREKYPHISPDVVTVAHINQYPHGKAALAQHQDKFPKGVPPNLPIFSYTAISHGTRLFSVTRDKAGKDIAKKFHLGNGDCLIMDGDFQKELWHGVPRTTKKCAMNQVRYNVTIRPWGILDASRKRPASDNLESTPKR